MVQPVLSPGLAEAARKGATGLWEEEKETVAHTSAEE